MEITYRTALPQDVAACAALFAQLHSASVEEMTAELSADVNSDRAAVFLALCGTDCVGCAQCSLRRDYVEGTSSAPVGYLEGIYVLPAHRKRGIAGTLVRCCEDWARAKGCTEFASDCTLDNTVSQAFHRRIGFTEANRLVCFTKRL